MRVYKEHFSNDPQIPLVATQDLDLLIPNPPKIDRKVDIPAILAKYDLEEVYSPRGEYSKFINPDFEVEFLYPMKGRGETAGKIIPDLQITATPLRYMLYIQDYCEMMSYRGISVRVPKPVVFVLMKYLLTKRRKPDQRAKIEKDIATAKDLEFFLLERGFQDEFVKQYNLMPGKWRKDLLMILKENKSDLTALFKE